MESGETEEEHVSFHVRYYKMRSSSLSDRMHLELLKKYISPSVQELWTTEARQEEQLMLIEYRGGSVWKIGESLVSAK